MTSSQVAERLGIEGVRSLQAWTPIAPEDAPRAAKALYQRLTARGWSVTLYTCASLRSAERYLSKSEHHNVGDLKKAAHVIDHWTLGARLGEGEQRTARLMAVWERERPAEGAKGKPVSFDHAFAWDVIGEELEFHRTAGSLEEWVGILAPKPEPKRKAQKPPAPSPEDQMIAELERGVWNG